MDLPETSINKKTFIGHVFSTTEEGKAELLNIIQYSLMGIIPIILLNKIIQQFVPEACDDKSSVELLIEIFIQIIIMFCGIIFIHRIITYFPTYSGFKYDNLVLTNVVLAFLIIVLSLQTKLGIKVNIIYDRVLELWNGTPTSNKKEYIKNNLKINNTHVPSQADYLDGGMSEPPPPPPPQQQQQQQQQSFVSELMPANSLLGSSFGSW
jgi:hypothetical protein